MEESINVCIFDESSMTWIYVNEIDPDGNLSIDLTLNENSVLSFDVNLSKIVELSDFLNVQLKKYYESKIASLENDNEVLTRELESTNNNFGI